MITYGRHPNRIRWSLTCSKFSVLLYTKPEVDDFKIVYAAPIIKVFVGQPLSKLIAWTRKKFGSFELVDLDRLEDELTSANG